MTQQIIGIGTVPNDGTGDAIRTAFTKCNGNFTELYGLGAGAFVNVTVALAATPTTATVDGFATQSNVAITADNTSNLGTGDADLSVSYVFGGSTVQGARVALNGYLQHTAATNAANTARQYRSGRYRVESVFGDGGTNTGAGALGQYFGITGIATLDATAVNVDTTCGAEAQCNTAAAATMRYAFGSRSLGNLGAHAASFDAGYAVAATGAHVGWKFGYCLTDAAGAQPMYSGSTVFGAFWTGATPTVTTGIDLTLFTFTGNAIQSPGFSIDGSGNLKARASTANAPTSITAATYTVATTDFSLIANFAGTVTLTLPAPASFSGRILWVKTIQAQTVVSASANVVPRAGGAAATAILAATAGNWAMMQSDGTNWILLAGTP